MNKAMSWGGWSGARLCFVVQRLECEDKSGGNKGSGDHVITGLNRWVHPWIHVGRWHCEAEDGPHEGGDESLRPEVVERRAVQKSEISCRI